MNNSMFTNSINMDEIDPSWKSPPFKLTQKENYYLNATFHLLKRLSCKVFPKKKKPKTSKPNVLPGKWNGGELFQGPNWRTSRSGHGQHYTLHCRQNVAQLALWPDTTFHYPRAKYFSSAENRDIWSAQPILCDSISQESSKKKVTLSG